MECRVLGGPFGTTAILFLQHYLFGYSVHSFFQKECFRSATVLANFPMVSEPLYSEAN